MGQIFFIVCIMRRWATSILLLPRQSKICLHQTKEIIDKQIIVIVLAEFLARIRIIRERSRRRLIGGAYRDRTGDLNTASVALSQLS